MREIKKTKGMINFKASIFYFSDLRDPPTLIFQNWKKNKIALVDSYFYLFCRLWSFSCAKIKYLESVKFNNIKEMCK